jgi:DNA processing protein
VIDRDDISAWVRLLATPGIGRDAARKLLAAFGSAEAVLAASTSSLQEVIGSAAASALGAKSGDIDQQVVRALAWLDEGSPEVRSIVTVGDTRYPPSLLENRRPTPPSLCPGAVRAASCRLHRGGRQSQSDPSRQPRTPVRSPAT